ncbi:MAG: hypothetical protein HZA51_18365 [Planctomycetes bacterium]|nr:hypothetical protein [Planctomycetota bacterium]
MSGRILERHLGRNGTGNGAADVPIVDQSEIDDLGCFGWLRGIRDRSLCLELRKANGNIVAIPYHGIDRFDFDPSEGILLSLGGREIRIKGRHLNAEIRPAIRLFEGMTRHRVSWVREADNHAEAAAMGTDTVIHEIDW